MKKSWLELEGKTVIVTGGASGIGKAVVQEFLDNGANVVVGDMSPNAPEFKKKDNSGEELYVKTDVSSYDSVNEMVS
uniref:SDR family NAD(P)-dependent oxidoreductase n=1 Tax=Clostridium arbusti TaxID=1137848 RepID=UPI00028A3113